jgi:type I restriction enzyme S subunit
MVPLGEVVSWRNEFVLIDDTQPYRRPRVQLHAQGIVLRDEVPGALIKTKRQQVCHTDDLLVAEIDAKMGGYGIVPSSLAGAIVSSHYFLFEIDHRRLLPRFLDFFTRTPLFADQIRARGSTNYSAIRASHVLGYTMPLPPLEVQRRIVERLNAVEAHLSTSSALRKAREADCEQLLRTLMSSNPATTRVPMGDLVRLREPDVIVDRSASYDFAGVYSFGRGVFRAGTKTGMDFAYPRLSTLREGDFTYPKLMAWEGALGVVPPECDGCVVSTEFPVFEVLQDRVLPEVLDVHFRNPSIWPQLAGASTGTNARRRRLNPSDFLAYQFPLPSRSVQAQVAKGYRLSQEVRQRDQVIDAETQAILPALLAEAFGSS